MVRQTGLGRGLESLIPTSVGGIDSQPFYRDIPIESIHTNKYQPRVYFEEEALVSLVDSIKQVGILQPILVRESSQETGYELIAGERRWRASKRAGLETIPAIIKGVSDLSSLEQALIENIHRENLNPLEESVAYRQLLDDFSLTHEEIATRVGKSRAAISNSLRLLQLCTSVQKFLISNQLSAGHARALLAISDPAEQEEMALCVINEKLSVRELESRLKQLSISQSRSSNMSPKKSHSKTPLVPAGILELEDLLSSKLETNVKVDLRKKKGRVVIEFATVEDLERIYRLLVD